MRHHLHRIARGPARLVGRHRTPIAALAVLAIVGAVPVATGAGEGDPLEGGVRNPSPNESQSLTSETEIIATTDTYGTRQSNKSDNGGGAIYGCRSGEGGTPEGNEPCIRANNLEQGYAFEFETAGDVAGRIEAGDDGGPDAKPFTTNATGVATGLNADAVHGLHPYAVAVAATGAVQTESDAAIETSRTAEGAYLVDVPGAAGTTCWFQATARSGPAIMVADQQAQDATRAVVRSFGADGTAADAAFYLTAQCQEPAPEPAPEAETPPAETPPAETPPETDTTPEEQSQTTPTE